MRTTLKMLLMLLGVCSVVPLVAQETPRQGVDKPAALPRGSVPMGTLRHPIGELLLVEVTHEGNYAKLNGQFPKISKIDGKELDRPVYISFDNVHIPKDTRCVIRGYEVMEMMGNPPALREFTQLKGERPPMEGQAGWQLGYRFVALEVVEPETLKLIPQRGR